MYTITVVYQKKEGARYLGHLDVMRAFIRTLRRAELPVKYSEGFNPHANLSFALPMGVGVTGMQELVKVVLTERVEPKEFISRFNAHAPGGLSVSDAAYHVPEYEITKAEYEILLEGENLERLADALAAEHLPAEKKSKRQTKTIDLKEHIFDYTFDLTEEGARLLITVSGGQNFNVKPSLVVDTLADVSGAEVTKALPCRLRLF